MPDDVFGVPLHPLVVHAVVVLVPLASLGAVVVALVPRWRRPYGWLVLAVTTVALASVPVATRTGEDLESSLTLGSPVLEKVQEHQEWGERVVWGVGALWISLLALLVMNRSERRGGVLLVAALTIAAAAVATGLVVVTGHRGSEAVWNPAG